MINFQTISKRTLRRILPRSRFVRSVSVLAGGTAASQGLIIIVSPLLTRLYSPDDYGLLAVFSAILGIVSVVACLRYQLAIPLPASDKAAAEVAVVSLFFAGVNAFIAALVVVFFRDSIASLIGIPAIKPYLWLLPVGVLVIGMYQVFHYWMIRTNAFGSLSRSKLAQTVGQLGVQVGAHSVGPIALMLGHVVGQSMGATRLGVRAIVGRWDLFGEVRAHGMRESVLKYKQFPLFSTWGALFNSTGSKIVPVLFASLFGPASAGIYYLAHRVLAMPMQLVGRAVADVFFSRAATASRDNEMDRLVGHVHVRLVAMALPPAMMLMFLGPTLFMIVFGNQWSLAGEFARWMSPWLFFVFVTSPLSTVPSITGRQAQEMLFQIVLLVVRIGALIIGAALNDLRMAVALFSLSSALCWLVFLIWVLQISGTSISMVLRDALLGAPRSLLVALPAVIFSLAGIRNIWGVVLLTVSTVLLAVPYYKRLLASSGLQE